jgi:hypothetical protein
MGIIGGSSSTTSCVSMMTLFRMSVVFACNQSSDYGGGTDYEFPFWVSF